MSAWNDEEIYTVTARELRTVEKLREELQRENAALQRRLDKVQVLMEAAIEQLNLTRKRLAEAEADRERLDWLEVTTLSAPRNLKFMIDRHANVMSGMPEAGYEHNTIREAIDAAKADAVRSAKS